MPRAKLSQERMLRANAQLVAASQVKASGEVQAVEEEVASVAAGVPSDLAATLAEFDARISAVEP